ncbi:Bax inhibitor-1/YccA family protein [Acrocarpospora macrocephala]|uniref:Membrane protein n=2 Tax=Acrocarpospora macrocephala TaxID=150177 RepID=A0A5M3WJ10_9ACTN|nr:membrane protein [Acrocarpospora macrocephala]
MYNAPSYAPPTISRTMTMDDVVMKGFIVLGVILATAGTSWYLGWGIGIGVGAALVALVLGLIVSFTQRPNPALVLGYAAFEGVFLGVISNFFEARYPGIVLQAVIGTMMAFLGTLAVYSLKIFRPTPKFTKFVIGAAIAAVGLILVNLIASFFVDGGLGLRSGGPLAIAFSVGMILLGCFFLLLDFDQINEGVRAGVPEKFSWLMAFGLALSLVWIYLEVLRLLSYFSGDD